MFFVIIKNIIVSIYIIIICIYKIWLKCVLICLICNFYVYYKILCNDNFFGIVYYIKLYDGTFYCIIDICMG